MTRLDLDTTTLATTGADLRDTAASLAAVPHGVLDAAAAPAATGDANLSAALGDLASAWRTSHEALVGALESAGAALTRAAEEFEGAEHGTAQALAALLTATPAGGDA